VLVGCVTETEINVTVTKNGVVQPVLFQGYTENRRKLSGKDIPRIAGNRR
jgi:hypothetical protein